MTTEKEIRQKAGVVAWRQAPDGTPEVLLVTSRRQPPTWIYPLGTMEAGETLLQTAQRECVEESGYVVEGGARLAQVDLVKQHGVIHRVTFFAARQVGELPNYERDRERRWVGVSDLPGIVPAVFAAVTNAAVENIPAIAKGAQAET